MRVAELMSTPAWTVRPETPLRVAAEIMAAQAISGLPVVDADDRALGVVSEADILAKERAPRVSHRRPVVGLGRGGPTATAAHDAVAAGEAMTAPAITVPADVRVELAAALMREFDVERLPVVDRDDRVVGVLSRADLVLLLRP